MFDKFKKRLKLETRLYHLEHSVEYALEKMKGYEESSDDKQWQMWMIVASTQLLEMIDLKNKIHELDKKP